MILTVFDSIFSDTSIDDLTTVNFLVCLSASLALGILLALAYRFRNPTTKSFTLGIALLPAIVCLVIIMVNGNLGIGVAVAGAFSLVRFRSVPGTAKEIVWIFATMAVGLAVGTGYIAYAAAFTAIMIAANIILVATNFGGNKNSVNKLLKITVPEGLDYTNVFEDIFKQFTKHCELVKVKTANLGSMFKLTYKITLTDSNKEREFLDSIRVRNGNLEVACLREDFQSADM
ncbi:MAG: DUF4956 domain-containing protein [Clostridia bacterium]|nr:DUF4956 domain-containing protein [Clostridia bacterium]